MGLYSLRQELCSDLLNDIQRGIVGLPDLQRPYVWKDSQVRDLIDSMLKGFPVGYIMLWNSPDDNMNSHHITDGKNFLPDPKALIIDGQQRLTGLYAALLNKAVIDKKFKTRKIKIAFNPLSCAVEVWSKKVNNAEWIQDISEYFKKGADAIELRKRFIEVLNKSRQAKGLTALSKDDESTIERNINKLKSLSDFAFPVLVIKDSADEEAVSQIFVRVNSGGQKLKESDFIETLLAVFDNDVHSQIHNFCEEANILAPTKGTAYNEILKVQPKQLIRMAVGLAFRRAQLRYAYKLMSGRNLETGETTVDYRTKNLADFKKCLNIVTNNKNWHSYMNLFSEVGYISEKFISSENAVVYCYLMYLIGQENYGVPVMELKKIIKKWIFMSLLTNFYTSSPETEVEKHLADLRDIHSAAEYVAYLESVIKNRLTRDFFSTTLINDFVTSANISPTWNAYVASLNILGAHLLFSTVLQQQCLLPSNSSNIKCAYDKHHIFPKDYLSKIGVSSARDRNQIANYTYLHYNTNIDISNDAPAIYVAKYKQKYGVLAYQKSCEENALPIGFETMDYETFLVERRKLMAAKIKAAYDRLCN